MIEIRKTLREAVERARAAWEAREQTRVGGQQQLQLDPVCIFHGLRASEHDCLYCALCFSDLTVEECNVRADGMKENVCVPCAQDEAKLLDLREIERKLRIALDKPEEPC